MDKLILIANPGSASRKYALYAGTTLRANIHFEHIGDQIVCTLDDSVGYRHIQTDCHNFDDAISQLVPLFQKYHLLKSEEHIDSIGLRIVAPSGYFLEDRLLDDEATRRLKELMERAPLHITATLHELERLRHHFPHLSVIGISDSAFHITKPERAWNYGIPLENADRFEIKRFGYHGLSVASAVHALRQLDKLPQKLIVAHLGSGASVSAVLHGRSVDTTMGYSPLEGLIMSTRSGSIDFVAARRLKHNLGLDDNQLERYLNESSGLKGLGGSPDIRELLMWEEVGDHKAKLALDTYTYTVQKSIGHMTAALGGIDAIVFTGTVGERSAKIRARILAAFGYLGFSLDVSVNNACLTPKGPIQLQQPGSKPIFVLPADEARYMVQRIMRLNDRGH